MGFCDFWEHVIRRPERIICPCYFACGTWELKYGPDLDQKLTAGVWVFEQYFQHECFQQISCSLRNRASPHGAGLARDTSCLGYIGGSLGILLSFGKVPMHGAEVPHSRWPSPWLCTTTCTDRDVETGVANGGPSVGKCGSRTSALWSYWQD